MKRAFLSYSRKDEAAVSAIEHDLKDYGLEVWIDKQLTGGQAWWDLILQRIRDCDCFLLGLSPDSLKSEACVRELNYAAALGKPVLPILLTDGVATKLLPGILSTIQHVDYRQSDKQAFIALTRALGGLSAAPALPEPLPAPPAVPISYLSSLSERVGTSETLNFDQQSVLLVELKASLRNKEDTLEVRQLLHDFRQRSDLLASVALEIDELFASQPDSEPRADSRSAGPTADPASAAPEVTFASSEVIAISDALQRVTQLVTHLQRGGQCWEVRADSETSVVLNVRGEYCEARAHYCAYIDFKLNKLRGMGWQIDLQQIAGDIAATFVIYLTLGLALLNEKARSRFRSKSVKRSWKLSEGADSAFEIAQTVVSTLRTLAPIAANYTLAKARVEQRAENGWQSYIFKR